MRLLLAPMEGLLDFTLRDVLTHAGGISHCVSEFIRVTDSLLPERVFFRVMPELSQGGRTAAGVPVRGQLLGSDPVCLGDNAGRLASLSAHGVDLNFGCPAKVVNRHGGGAALLDDPELLHRIVREVSRCVPAGTMVSAKMRLGTLDDLLALECAQALVAGGAQELVVHGRTRVQGYRPPADWVRIGDIRAAVPVPVVANGEIWTVEDARRCLAASGCASLMLGRGIVSDPGLARAIVGDRAASEDEGGGSRTLAAPSLPWHEVLALFAHFWNLVQENITPRYQAGRLKQWLNLLRRRYPEAELAYQALRTENHAGRLAACMLHPGASSAGADVGARYTGGLGAAAPWPGAASDGPRASLPVPPSALLHGCVPQGEPDRCF